MNYIVGGLSVFVFLKTIGYALFEQKENHNATAAIILYVLSLVCLIAPNVVMSFI